MIRKIIYISLFFSLNMLSQNEQLRIEIIDVFKEYAPEISNSIKISEQPIFNDTLKNKIFTKRHIRIITTTCNPNTTRKEIETTCSKLWIIL